VILTSVLLLAIGTVLTALQLTARALVSGTHSAAFITQLWGACFIWLGIASMALIVAPVVAPADRALGQVRLASGAIQLVTLPVVVWLWRSGRIEPPLVLVAVVILLAGWSGSFIVGRFRSRAVAVR
jgi:Ca2+/Na+ antiporter